MNASNGGDISTPSGPSGVWSVVVDFLADDFEQAVTRRGLIEVAVTETGIPTSVSTVAEARPLIDFQTIEDIDDGL